MVNKYCPYQTSCCHIRYAEAAIPRYLLDYHRVFAVSHSFDRCCRGSGQ